MAIKATRKKQWFTAFPKDYRWSFITSISLMRVQGGAADTSEIFEICRRLEGKEGNDSAWVREWTRMGDRVRAMAQAAQRKGNNYTAADCYNRACNYYQAADRFMFPKDKKSKALYRRSIECFHRYLKLTDSPRAEIVEIPFEGKKKLPAYFIHAQNTKKARPPVVVQYTGFDGTKEGGFALATLALVRRGMSVLLADTPGVGEAIRFRGIYLRHDYEVAGTAILDWLEKRKDVNARRAAIFASSLGGYYAPRTAAYEPRFKAAIAWGAQWDYHAIWKRRIEAGYKIQLPSPGAHLAWSFNTKTAEEALEKLKGFRLDGVAQKMKCPFLLVHGGDDQQIPLSDAKKLFNAAGSKDKTMRVYSGPDGGAQHCHMDYLQPVVSYLADWTAEKLGA